MKRPLRVIAVALIPPLFLVLGIFISGEPSIMLWKPIDRFMLIFLSIFAMLVVSIVPGGESE